MPVLGGLSSAPLSQVHQLEFILDSLVDEKDRSTQKRGEGVNGRVTRAGPGQGSTNSASDGSSQLSLEISVSRPAEIEAALQQFVSPKVGSEVMGCRMGLGLCSGVLVSRCLIVDIARCSPQGIFVG